MRTLLAAPLVTLLACAASHPPAPPAAAPAPAPAPEPAYAPPPLQPGIDPTLVDRSVNPCDDFYAFACNGWLARTEIPPDHARWTRSFDVMAQEKDLRLRGVLEGLAAGEIAPENATDALLGDLYAGCMDEDRIERNGLSDLRAEWRAVDGVRDEHTLAAAVGRLHRRAVFPLFALTSAQDARDATQVIGNLRQGGLSLPDRDYYLKDDAAAARIREDFRAHVEKELRLAGLAPEKAAAEARSVLEVETELARSHWTRAELRDPVRTYNRLDLVGLRKAAPRFDWDRYLSAAGAAGITAFSTTTPPMLAALDALVRRLPAGAWRAYLRWHVLDEAAAARALPRELSEEAFWFRARHFSGETAMPERWRHCVQLTDDLLGEALGRVYVRRFFGAEARDRARVLVGDVAEAMRRSLESRGWMDGPTRQHAEEKLAAVARKIGYPDVWRSYQGLKVRRGDFYGSVRSARAFEERRKLAQIGKPPDPDEWRMTAPTVNAYYSPSLNEIVFPAGILEPPFFTNGANDAVNYGAIGLVMGHELSHGFDDSGRQYDARGNLADWWTREVGQEFLHRAACIERQYAGYVAVDDLRLDGKLTLGENIADLGGLALAWDAYRASRQGKPPEAPVAGFSADQQFFLAHAQAWCQLIRPENARLRVITDPHSPARWRVNGPLSNLPTFQEAFGCRAGDRMVRAERCQIW
jgi:endothelin-converting enzyme/putative endopeptidase